ncbi:MAG: hypothetical protein RLZ26_2670 [Pseudomonadota bacterium]
MRDRLCELSDLAEAVSEIYASRFGILRDDLWYLAKLGEEVGELNGAWLSLNGRGRDRGRAPEELKAALADEAADVLAMLLLIARKNDIDLAAALWRKWGHHLTAADAR